ncbi:MAG: TolC family protein [Cyclobacteriaceae bacterium]|nr:TolC family protein [Cyclobacteriaceae bacterium]
MSRYLVLLLIVVHSWSVAQKPAMEDALFVLPDSVKPFTVENFYSLILQNHPVAKQSALLTEVAQQEIRMARGNFDPKLEAQLLTKNYNDQEYYSIVNGSLKFPTVFPVDPVIGVERNSGSYLNPERYVGNEFNYQQFYAGISIPLGRGLITDDRRAALRQADLFKELTEAEQVKLINQLLLEAAKEYWQWYNAYYNYRLLNQSVAIAEEIFRRVSMNYEFGEASQIDTIQAKITWQQRIIEQKEAALEFQNSGIRLSTFLWDSLSNPLSLDMQWAPVRQPDPWMMTPGGLEELTNQAKTNHPDLLKLNIKLQQLEVERKLATEYLKPKLNLNYYLLNQPFNPDWNTSLQLNEDYKLGVDFSIPVFLRKERSKLAQTKLKVTNTQYDRSLTERQIINDLNSTYNQLVNILSIVNQQREMIANYERLLNAEMLNLQQGESDLFKINVQQEKLIQSQTKWLKLLSDFEKQKAYLYWAAGTRHLGRT